MRDSIRRVRGVLGTAATWAAGWFGVGVIGWGAGLFPAALAFTVPTAGVLATVGAIAGAGFAALLGATERRRTLRELTFPRVASWGACGAVAIGVTMSIGMAPLAFIGTSLFVAALGASSAAATVALAKSADARSVLEAAERDTSHLLA